LRQCNTRNTNLIGTQRSQGTIYENPFLGQIRSRSLGSTAGLVDFNVGAVRARPKGTQQGHPTCEE
jgi:hypothetical protein